MLGRRGILVHSWKQARPSLPHRPGLASHPFQPVLAQLRHHFANLNSLLIKHSNNNAKLDRASERFRSSRKLVWSAALVGNRRLSNRSNSPTCVSAACAAAGTAPRKRSANLPRRSVKPRLSASSRPRPAPPAAAASASAASWYSRSSRIRSGVPCAAFHKACSLSSSCLSDRPFSPATSLGLWMSQKRKKADLTVLPPLSD
mmetsp:Transcript_42379/g.113356  ORF Transcript_42379/g.113356 Transcript_42379/m.113356 type:complete len:202 (+) Transcript_42379:416-1021(+)